MRTLSLIVRLVIVLTVVAVTLFIYDYAHDLAVRIFAGPYAHLNSFAAMLMSGLAAGAVAVALWSVLWNR